MPSDVELYQRTYSTLLRSRGETKLRILESSHIAIESSLHPLAGSDDLALGAFLSAPQRLPATIYQGRVVVMGQETEQFAAVGGDLNDWPTTQGPPRPRQWHTRAGANGPRARTASGASCCPRPPTSMTSSRRSSPTRSSGTSCGASSTRSA